MVRFDNFCFTSTGLNNVRVDCTLRQEVNGADFTTFIFEYVDDSLIFTFDYIFSYEIGIEQTHKAKIVFEKCDVDDLEILVFNSTILDTFTGKKN